MGIEGHVVARLLVALALGAAVGLEREASDQPAGLRTHLAVALGAALFGVISTLGFDEFEATRNSTNVQVDVTRVASQVVVGISFLGAGLIFRRGTTIHNLTTAASLWVVAAIGLACGVGDFAPAVVTTVAMLAGLVVLRVPRAWIRRHLVRDVDSVRITLVDGCEEAAMVDALRSLDGVDVMRLTVGKDVGATVVTALLRAEPGRPLGERIRHLVHRDDVRSFVFGGPATGG